MKKGFSLIELLISLIILSMILTFMIPIMTKKLKRQNLSASISFNCKKFDSTEGKCLLCQKDKCELCTTSINDKQGYFVNSNESCDYQKCSIAACSRCNKDACLECRSGFTLLNNKCIIEDNDNLKRYNNMYVTRKNMGDSDILTIKGVNLVPVGTFCASNDKCCWYGITSAACDNSGYSSCTRTVCNYYGAKAACDNFDYLGLKWRLATPSELYPIGDNPEFWFCTYNPKASFKQCKNGVSKCLNSNNTNCRPNDYWVDNGMCAHNNYTQWTCGSGLSEFYAPAGVRCVSVIE